MYKPLMKMYYVYDISQHILKHNYRLPSISSFKPFKSFKKFCKRIQIYKKIYETYYINYIIYYNKSLLNML